MAQVVHDDLRGAENLPAPAVSTLGDFKYGMVRLGGIVTGTNRLMAKRIKRFAQALFRIDIELAKDLAQLLQDHIHSLKELFERRIRIDGKCALQIVNDWQEFADQFFFLTQFCCGRDCSLF